MRSAGRRRRRRLAPLFPPLAAAVLFAAAPAIATADEFFPVRDENPLIRAFYLPLPSDSRLSDGQTLAATLSISNTLNVENRPHENLLVDGESDTLTALL